MSAWQPIETIPLYEQVLIGSYYDTFRVREGFPPIWEFVEGHAYRVGGRPVEFSFRNGGRLTEPPTHWQAKPAPPPYVKSAARLAYEASGDLEPIEVQP